MASSSSTPSIIGADVHIKGSFNSKGDVQIDGKINGNITALEVAIGVGASVIGDVAAKSVHIAGNVKGNVQAEAIEVRSSGKVDGDLVHRSLSIEPGAKINGCCKPLGDNDKVIPIDTGQDKGIIGGFAKVSARKKLR